MDHHMAQTGKRAAVPEKLDIHEQVLILGRKMPNGWALNASGNCACKSVPLFLMHNQ
jgi:hypothetical protein